MGVLVRVSLLIFYALGGYKLPKVISCPTGEIA